MFEGYDLPAHLAAIAPEGVEGPTYPALLKQWGLVEYAFRAELGVDLEAVRHVRSWRWFRVMVDGLLGGDNPLARHFNPRAEG